MTHITAHPARAVLALFLLGATSLFAQACGESNDEDCTQSACGADVQVDACPAGASCYEADACGATVTCRIIEDQCFAEATCPQGSSVVQTCDVADADCEFIQTCGAAVYCEKSVCTSGCEPDDMPASPCPAGATCYESNSCGGGQVMLCLEVASCELVCDPGDAEEACMLSDADCYEKSACDGWVSTLCRDVSIPEHGCPAQVTTGDACEVEDDECNYPTDAAGCFETMLCIDTGEGLQWSFAGAGCGD